MRTFTAEPRGPFDLSFQNTFFNGWPTSPDEPDTIVMAFPVEQAGHSVVVTLRQPEPALVTGEVHGGPDELAGRAWAQALAALSLDLDGTGWPEVGQRDARVADLQAEYHLMRPSLFHSPYEAAAALLIGHRISIAQTRVLRGRLSERYGERFRLGGKDFFAFPTPERLLEVTEFPGIPAPKIPRLHALARAAQEGWLSRAELRAAGEEEALRRLQTLPGVGPFFASGILHRGAGSTDGMTHDELSNQAVGDLYALPDPVTEAEVLAIAEAWRPYRMWVTVLMHVHLRSQGPSPRRTSGSRT